MGFDFYDRPRLHVDVRARALIQTIQKKLAAIAQSAGGGRKASALVIAGRNADELKNMYIIGNNDFLHDLLEIAGGINAYRGAINYPNISLETVILLNPDFIFEISAHYENISDAKVFELWRPFKMVRAVRNRHIKIIKQSFWLRPGPRVWLIAEELGRYFSAANDLKKSSNAD